jgi:hypothetical protein
VLVRRLSLSLGAWAVALAPLSVGRPAHAQTLEALDRAKALFVEATAAAERDDWRGALSGFRDAAQIAETPGIRFNIANCEEHLGQLAAAIADFRLAKREAARGGAPDVAANVDRRIEVLDPRVPRLSLVRAPGAERAAIQVDATPVEGGALIELDPGAHRVTAVLGGVTRFDEQVRLSEGERSTVRVALRPLPAVPGRISVPGVVTGAVGIAGLAAAGIFLGLRQVTIGELNGICRADDHCPVSAQPTIDRGRLFTGLAEGSVVLGVVGLTAGVILIVRSARASSSGGARVSLRAAPAGLAVEGLLR